MTSSFEIRRADLTAPAFRALIRSHLAHSWESTPETSIHTLTLDGLEAPDVTVWSLYEAGTLIGTGALKHLDASDGELKSMHTAEAHRGKGAAAAMLRFLLEEARRRGYARVSLETGSMEAYAAARRLYQRFGFVECPPFADYRPDPNSRFYSLPLT